MEGREFAPPPHLLSDRGALVHRSASRIAPTGHSSVQHPGHFQTGKYYPSHLPMAPHSGSGLMGNSSASFMGTFLASSLGSPPSHPSHPPGPPASPSSPSFRGGPHSSSSQIWFPHSHEGYPHFSGSLAHTFLPMGHLDHHGNSSVLYGQHPFYDAQKENFYLRGLPSQQSIISANRSLSAVGRSASGQPLRSCSRERDIGTGALHKGLKEAALERVVIPSTKERERTSGKHDAKERQQHKQHHHPHLQRQPSLEDENSRVLARHKATLGGEYKDDLVARGKQLSACLHNAKTQVDNPGGSAKGSLSSCSGPGASGTSSRGTNHDRHPGGGGNSRCSKEGVNREMRISEPPIDCLERTPMLHHSVPYSMPPPVGSAANAGGFHCLPLHPSHPHHPPHHPHHPYHSDFYSPPPPPPAPLANPGVQEKAPSTRDQDPKAIGPTFVPSVGHQGDKSGGPFQLGNSDCRRTGSGRSSNGNSAKDKAVEKSTSESTSGSNGGSSWSRKQQSQQPSHQLQTYGKADKAPDWPQGQHQRLQQPNQPSLPSGHPCPQGRSGNCVSGTDLDLFRSSLPQGALNTPSYHDCSHLSLSPSAQPPEGKTGILQAGGTGGNCVLQQDGQNVARIPHQQQARSSQDSIRTELGQDGKRKLEMPGLGYGGGPQQQPVPPWTARAHHIQAEEEQRKVYLESLTAAGVGRLQGQQELPNIRPSSCSQDTQVPQGEVSAMRSLLKYSSQHQPHLLSQRSPFGGLGCLKTGASGGSCLSQASKQGLPSKKGSTIDGDRSDCGGSRGRETGDTTHRDGEVRQPPVGIAVAVARHSEPPCHPLDGPSNHSRQGKVMPVIKGHGRPTDGLRTGFPLDADVEEGRKRICNEQLRRSCLERERELLVRDKKMVEFARIHPSSSCHGDLASHIMVPTGTSLQSSQLGADPSSHAHPTPHHWMPQTGSSSLWMAGHSYAGISLHQNLPPGFSSSMPSPLQPVLPLPQDPSTPLVVLPGEPTTHPATHHLDVMEQSSLWPPVYGARGAPSHIQHAAVYSRSQFLRQQEIYALQQQQQHRAAQAMELQHRNNLPQSQKKTEEAPVELEELMSEPGTPTPAKPFPFITSQRREASPGSCTSRLSPYCHSPSLRSHPKSMPCTPCPAPSPAAATPHSPALSPTLSRTSKRVDPQDMRAEGQPPQDYPQSLEPDLPPGYSYPAMVMGYRGGPSPQDVQLAEPADLEAIQAEPSEPAPPPPPPTSPPAMGKEPECTTMRGTDLQQQAEATMVDPTIGEISIHISSELKQQELYSSCCIEDSPVCEVPTTVEDMQSAKSALNYQEVREEIPKELDEEDTKGLQEKRAEVVELDSEPHRESHSSEGKIESRDEALEDGIVVYTCTSPSHAVKSSDAPPLGCWSLELLIAAALCDDIDTPPLDSACPGLSCPGSNGMQLLSEMAELESRQLYRSSARSSQEDDLLTFDLESLATLAAARALELGSPACIEAAMDQGSCIRRTVNLRRKCSWTPRHEPVCPVKGSMETIGAQELAMRMRLAELQRRYKEKQRELVKLQRKHDNQKEETPRSPARRGPGRPRKRRSAYGPGLVTPVDVSRTIKSPGPGFDLQAEDLIMGREMQNKKKLKQKMSTQSLDGHSTTQMKARCCKPSNQTVLFGSKLTHKASELKQKAKAMRGSTVQCPADHRLSARTCSRQGPAKCSNDSDEPSESEEDEEESSYDSDEGQDSTRAPLTRDTSSSSIVTGPSPSSIVKLEANQKAKNKKERQGLSGALSLSCTEGQVKVKRRAPSRSMSLTTTRKRVNEQEQEKARRVQIFRPGRQQLLWQKQQDRAAPGTISERLKRATRKTQQRPLRNANHVEPKGRAVSRLLESFAANEGFQMDEDSSFSEGDEDNALPRHGHHMPRSSAALPNCILTKELLVDGLKVLISKEDELLYTARVHTLDLPDIYNIVIDGERGNRRRIYTLEQLLHEAVLDVSPETEAALTEGTRVCAYWSERSRCLYPGYVRRGGACEEGKAGGVMVEFDDGDRGWISLHNIRHLPPDYQIHSTSNTEQPSLVGTLGQKAQKNSTVEKVALNDKSVDKPSKTDTAKDNRPIAKARPGRPKGSGTKNSSVNSINKTTNPLLSWPPLVIPKKKAVNNPFQFNGTLRKPPKKKEFEAFPQSASTAAPAKGIFRSCFPVDSFSSIANGYLSFGSQRTGMSVSPRGALCSRSKKASESGGPQGRKAELLVKLDHEGVTSPKTKNGKALLLLGLPGHGGQVDRVFGTKGISGIPQPVGYSHPVLLVKDSKKGDFTSSEILHKGASHLHKPTSTLAMADYTDFSMNCHSDCPSSYSDMDEEEEEDDDERGAPLLTASGSLRTTRSFLSRLSMSSSSSGSSSSSSSGSLSSSSLCSSDNDSSCSSEDEDSSTLLLQGCLSSHHPPLQPPDQASGRASFVAKAMAVAGTKGGNNNSSNSKPLKRKECPSPIPRNPKDLAKRQKLHAISNQPKNSSFLPARQLWKWSGNPTQRRGLKGKARKLFYKAIVRGRETVHVGDCAVFLSAGRPNLPYVGRIESFWESWSSNMVVKVKWFYHPEETKLGKRHRDGKHALYQSSHEDENDVQTISHKCQVVSREEYEQLSRVRKTAGNSQDLYYLAGSYDPTTGQLVTTDGLPILC